MSETLKVCLVQQSSSSNIDENITEMLNIISGFSDADVDLVLFPENCFCVSGKDDKKYFDLDDMRFDKIQKVSVQKQIGILCGGVPLREHNSISNSVLFFNPNGSIQSLYKKIHLFDVELGNIIFKESDFCTPGNETVVFDYMGWKLGLSICYDVRFPELYIDLVNKGAEVLLIPACFTVPTGRAHWKTLVRSRAIESQCYVLAPAQVGRHLNSTQTMVRESWGESMVVNPWGEITHVALNFDQLQNTFDPKRGTTVLKTELIRQEILNVRSKIPMSNHRVFSVHLGDRR